jgi:hypothetical protein
LFVLPVLWEEIRMTEFIGIPPTFTSVDQEILRAAVSAIDSGVEYAQELLAVHDDAFGRSRERHKREAVMMEQDIAPETHCGRF